MLTYLVIGILLGILLAVIAKKDKKDLNAAAREDLIKQLAAEEAMNDRYLEEIQGMQAQLLELDGKYNNQLDANRELLRQKSSQATKSGAYIETLAPFLEKFPVDIFSKEVSVKFLGDPIDFIAYDFEKPEIVFIEVKSGDAVLSKRQKLVKKIIAEGLIRFIEYHMQADGSIEVKE